MTSAAAPRRPRPRIGLFGLLGSGNLGNDGSLEAVLAALRAAHPDAEFGAFCAGPARVRSRFGVPARHLHWYDETTMPVSGPAAAALKAVGKVLDAARTVAWVRRFDVVVVPGMGVLEASVPLRPWGFPYALFLVGLAGRVTGTRVAMVGVGADVVHGRLLRRLITSAARQASYRSYRDEHSRDAMRTMGLDTSDDEVYPDLAFALPAPDPTGGSGRVAGVGVMSYRGDNRDRHNADEVHERYVASMVRIVGHLLDTGHKVRLFTGDDVDQDVVTRLLADPAIAPRRDSVVAVPPRSLSELMEQMATVDLVIATRYHNVLCALKLAKPTISIGYAAKNEALMAMMGMADYAHDIRTVDIGLVLEQVPVLEESIEEIGTSLAARNRATSELLQQQFRALADVVTESVTAGRDRPHRRQGRRRAMSVIGSVRESVWRTGAKAEDYLQRALAAAGLGHDESRIAADSQQYWNDPSGSHWKGDSHWRDAGTFADNDIWSRIGARHLEMFDRGARAVQFDRPLARVVEWGCGGGANAVHFAPRSGEYIGVDVAADSLAECARQTAAVCDTPFTPVLVEVADPEKALPEIGGNCDLFLSFYVFELIPTPQYGERILRIAYETLAPGGAALIQIKYGLGTWLTRPRRRGYRSGLADMTTYQISEFWELAQRCGFTPELVELVPKGDLDERYAYFFLTRPGPAR